MFRFSILFDISLCFGKYEIGKERLSGNAIFPFNCFVSRCIIAVQRNLCLVI